MPEYDNVRFTEVCGLYCRLLRSAYIKLDEFVIPSNS